MLITVLKTTIVVLTAYLLYRLLALAGVFRRVKPEKLSEESVKTKLQNEKIARQRIKILDFLTSIGNKANHKSHSFEVFDKSAQRLNVEAFGSVLTGTQLRGLVTIIGVACISSGIVWTLLFGFSMFNGILLGAGFIALLGYQAVMDSLVAKKDKLLDEGFSDLFLMVYSSIVDETGTPLVKCLNTFIKANNYKLIRYEGEELKRAKEVIAFATDYSSLLTKLPETTATLEIRKKYGTSSMIINFCTIVEQRLSGKNNTEKLIKFKQELLGKKIRLLEKKNETVINRGGLVVNMIYIILIEVIMVSAISGLPLDSFSLSTLFR